MVIKNNGVNHFFLIDKMVLVKHVLENKFYEKIKETNLQKENCFRGIFVCYWKPMYCLGTNTTSISVFPPLNRDENEENPFLLFRKKVNCDDINFRTFPLNIKFLFIFFLLFLGPLHRRMQCKLDSSKTEKIKTETCSTTI